jgi:hypothetical protein
LKYSKFTSFHYILGIHLIPKLYLFFIYLEFVFWPRYLCQKSIHLTLGK